MSGSIGGVEPLDRSSSVPLWSQLEAELRRGLELGRFDEHFPTDLELTGAFGVSRHTAREAIGHLTRDGLIRRVRGRGTAVVKREFEQPLGALYSLFSSIENQGVQQTSKVLSLGVVTDEVAAGQLGVSSDVELVLLERIRFAGGSPLALDRAWMPADLARPLLDADFSHTALYDELERVCGARPSQGWERITPLVPASYEREALELGESDAAFFVERRSGVADGRIIEWRTTVIRGDRFRFVNQWSGGSNDLRFDED